MSLFSDFTTAHSIATEDLVAASNALEKHTVGSRAAGVKRADARRVKKPYEELSAAKPARLGRGVSADVVRRALDGKPIPRLARQKLLRAVNARLASQKKDAIDWRALFADTPVKKGKSLKKK